MLKFYAVPISLYCAKLRIVLRHKKLQWQEVLPPGGYGSDEYNRLVPAGNLPALEHDGLLLADSEAIAEYLNEIFPEPDMLPGDAVNRAQIRARSRFHDTRLEPAVRMLFEHISKTKRDDVFVERQWSVVKQRLDQLVPLLPDRAEGLTLGDCGLPVTFTWIAELTPHFGMQPVLSDRVQEYLRDLNRIEAVSKELADYQPSLIRWLAKQ